MKTKSLLSLLFLTFSFLSFSQGNFWKLSDKKLQAPAESHWHKISGLKIYEIDYNAFRQHLLNVIPAEDLNAAPVSISIPFPDGSIHTFQVVESAVMEPGLAVQFPEIKTYKGTSGSNYMRMLVSPYSFQVYVITDHGDIVMEAIDKKNLNILGVFNSNELKFDLPVPLKCGVQEFSEAEKTGSVNNDQKLSSRSTAGLPVNLRTYRIAISCTGEWGSDPSKGGGSIATAINKMAESLTYINAVYEKDVAIHLNLISNNNLIIWLDGAFDPYPNPNGGGDILGINTEVLNARVGFGAYDIGHCFTNGCSDVGGIAFLGCVCGGNKGGGVTCWYTSDIAYVTQRICCHEMGHQFNASHTFSNCNGNESGTSYEPGSGTTIMSYSGLCGPDLNVETSPLPHPNYFHTNSVERIYNFSRNDQGSNCGMSKSTGNSFPDPEILFPSGLHIPIRTPFALRGRATDMENDTLTYNWEQYDAGRYGPILGEPSLIEEGPLFKSVFPGPNPKRVIPVWNTILTKGNFERTEVLPTVSRDINFRFNVRDNHAGAGATAWKEVVFRALESAGPFTVTNPNYPQTDTLFTGGMCNKIKWDVANTSKSLVNCKKVNVYLIPNRITPEVWIPLALNTENDGEVLVQIPDSLNGFIRSRILVEAADNIFFDVSDADIRIKTPGPNKINLGLSPSSLTFCVPNKTDIAIVSCSSPDVIGEVSMYIESGLPQNARYNFVKSTIGVNEQTSLHLDFSDVKNSGVSTLVVVAITPKGDTIRETLELDLVSIDFSDLQTVYPADGLSGLKETIEFSWTASRNAISYILEVATSPAFGNTTIYSISGITGTTFKPNFLFPENKLFYWRVIPTNRCGPGQPTVPSPFHTVNKSCVETESLSSGIKPKANQTAVMITTINESGIISDINVTNVKANAIGINSLSLTMISPLGTRVKLFDKNCGVTDQINCSFDDDGLFSFINPSNACPPVFKSIKPLESLSKFNGEDKKGDWQFEVSVDNRISGSAELTSYSLDICSELVINDPFLINNLGLRMSQGETKNISTDLLLSQDNDNTPAELIYTVVIKTQRGDLLINGVVADYGSQFTQKDIDDGKLSYQHKGLDNEIDEFLFTVRDGKGGWFGTETFRIYIGTVGTDEETEDLNINVFPNPTSGTLQIATDKILDQSADLKIMDLQGKIWYRKNMGLLKADVLNLQHLQNGVYILEIRSGKYYSVRKIVKN